MRNRMARLHALATAAVLGLACSDSGAPSGQVAQAYTVGDTISFEVPAGDSIAYRFHAPRSGSGTVYLQTAVSQTEVGLYDSETSVPLGGFAGVQGGLLLLQNYSNRMTFSAGQDILMRVRNPSSRAAIGRLVVDITGDDPEALPDTVALNTIYDGESLSSPGDLDRFAFPVVAGHGYVVYLQPSDHPAPSKFLGAVRLFAASVRVEADHQATTIDSNSSAGYTSTFTGFESLEISYRRYPGLANLVVPGAYRFEVREVNEEPESGDSVLVSGDTVTSTLDYAGDIDRFAIQAHAGDVISAVGEALGAPGGAGLQLALIAPAGDTIIQYTLGFNEWLDAGSYTATQDGIYHVAVTPFDPRDRSTYRVLSHVSPAAAPRHLTGAAHP